MPTFGLLFGIKMQEKHRPKSHKKHIIRNLLSINQLYNAITT